MASTRSGAAQTLTIGTVALQPEDGLEGVTLTPSTDTYTVTSGGIERVANAGGVTVAGSFTCLETERTNGLLLGQNGARVKLTFARVSGKTDLAQQCVLTVSRNFEDRGARKFAVSFMVDGDPTP